MNLAIFDLDGTLTDTNEIDTECFVAAWRQVHDIDCSALDWSSFADVTDRGIAMTLCDLHFAADERRSAYQSVKSRFLALLEEAARGRPETFRAVPGALELPDFLEAHGWGSVIATGAWERSAEIKLAAAGFRRKTPISSSDPCGSRQEIVRAAIELAARTYESDFDRLVLIGDAVWDVATAAELGLPFVGRAAGSEVLSLLAAGAGADTVLEDFTDPARAERALATATVPRRRTD
jgi:phosphoglycolate phosphatase-like HAD superfamily hydrolase